MKRIKLGRLWVTLVRYKDDAISWNFEIMMWSKK